MLRVRSGIRIEKKCCLNNNDMISVIVAESKVALFSECSNLHRWFSVFSILDPDSISFHSPLRTFVFHILVERKIGEAIPLMNSLFLLSSNHCFTLIVSFQILVVSYSEGVRDRCVYRVSGTFSVTYSSESMNIDICESEVTSRSSIITTKTRWRISVRFEFLIRLLNGHINPACLKQSAL